MVSGDVVFRVMHILAFIGAVPLSSVGVLLAARDLRRTVTEIGENYTIVILVAVAAILIFTTALLIVRYPIPREAALGLRVGIFSSVLTSIIFWGWLTHTYAYTFPLVILSQLYAIATVTFLDFLLATMTILVALVITIERI